MIEDWKEVLTKAWSVYGAAALALLGVADQVLPLFQNHLPPLVYAFGAALIIVLRVFAQGNLK